MTRDAIIFGISGTFFGVLIGWIIGTQQAVPRQAGPATAQAGPPLDLQRASALEQQAKAQPSDARVRAELANLYFDAQRFDLAIPWYEASHKLDAKNVDVSTDLAVSYYYTDKPDEALAQIERSLAVDPRHPKTLLNQGIIRAFGKQDLKGALASWKTVLEVAPNSPEAARAQQGIDGLQAGHAADAAAPAAGDGRSGRGK